MGSLTRRQILLGGTAIAAAGLIPAIPRTPLTPSMKLMQSALAAEWAHPTQIYSWAIAIALFLPINFLYRRRPFPGFIAGLWIAAYAVARFCIELLRLDTAVEPPNWMTISQKVSMWAFVVGVAVMVVAWKLRPRAEVLSTES